MVTRTHQRDNSYTSGVKLKYELTNRHVLCNVLKRGLGLYERLTYSMKQASRLFHLVLRSTQAKAHSSHLSGPSRSYGWEQLVPLRRRHRSTCQRQGLNMRVPFLREMEEAVETLRTRPIYSTALAWGPLGMNIMPPCI